MGNLPKKQVNPPSKAFQNASLDLVGPFDCKNALKNVERPHMILSVCFASKAVHIEAVTNNTTPICQLSEDPNDSEILTPVHLCLGGKLETLPLIESDDNNTTNTF